MEGFQARVSVSYGLTRSSKVQLVWSGDHFYWLPSGSCSKWQVYCVVWYLVNPGGGLLVSINVPDLRRHHNFI